MPGPGEQVPSARCAASSVPGSGRRVAQHSRLAARTRASGTVPAAAIGGPRLVSPKSENGQGAQTTRDQTPSHELRSHD
jgi:hypothetical protein